jgi:hypothetical protein
VSISTGWYAWGVMPRNHVSGKAASSVRRLASAGASHSGRHEPCLHFVH